MEKKIIHLLMIEDSFGDARLIYEMLRDSSTIDFKIEQAFRLSTGIEMLKNRYFDIVLLDLALPDSFGLDTLKNVIPETKGIPIVVMTANDDEALGIKAVHLGAQDYIMKLQYDSYSLVKALCFAIERKKNEEILNYQTRLLNNVNDGIIVIDREFKIISWNKAAEIMYGWKDSEVIGKNICNVIESSLCTKNREEIIRILVNGQDYISEIVQKNNSGTNLFVEEKLMGVFSSDGVLTGYICLNKNLYFENVTEKQDANTILIKLIFESTNVMLAYLDKDLNIIKLNNAFAKLLLNEDEAYSGKCSFPLFHDHEIESALRRAIETGEPSHIFSRPYEPKLFPEKGNLYLDWNIAPVKNSKGAFTGLVLSITDVTIRTKVQAEILE